jgi:recombination protein RecA
MKTEEIEQKQTSRVKALDAALSQIEKQFGKGTVMKLGQKEAAVKAEVIPTGSIAFDLSLGIGGFPRGRVIEIFGPEATGKTTLALHVIAEAQNEAARQPLLTPNMPLTLSMPPKMALMLMIC